MDREATLQLGLVVGTTDAPLQPRAEVFHMVVLIIKEKKVCVSARIHLR